MYRRSGRSGGTLRTQLTNRTNHMNNVLWVRVHNNRCRQWNADRLANLYASYSPLSDETSVSPPYQRRSVSGLPSGHLSSVVCCSLFGALYGERRFGVARRSGDPRLSDVRRFVALGKQSRLSGRISSGSLTTGDLVLSVEIPVPFSFHRRLALFMHLSLLELR